MRDPFGIDTGSLDTDWRLQALCRQVDPELFFPEGDHPVIAARQAKAVCRQCPVQLECLEYALTNNETFGVWGGMTARERRDLPYKTPRTRDECRNGHEFTPENTRVSPNGTRRCRACASAYERERNQRRRAGEVA